MHTIREGRAGDHGGGHKPGNNWKKFGAKTIDDNKAGYKEHDDGNKKYGKEGKKKDAEQKPRKSFKS